MSQGFKIHPITATGKGRVKQLRREGQIPVSIQHRGQGTLHFQTEAKPLDDFVKAHGEAAMLDLIEDGGVKHRALVHDIQRDGISKKLLQVTFQGVQGDEKVKVHIPIVFVGEPETIRLHTATLQHQQEQIEVRCRPNDIPDHITVDVSEMTIHTTMRVSDIPKSDKYEILTSGDTVIAALSSLQAQVKAEAVIEAAAAA